MGKINLFGPGFIGGRFCDLIDNVIVNDRDDYDVKTNNILYFISTVDNYNVYENPFLDINTNLNVLIKVLENCKGKDVVFNFISSWFVYGDVELPAKESSYCNPKGFYSITKRAAEQLLISYCETFNLKYRIIRMANVIGPQDKKVSKKKNALQYMVNKVMKGEDIHLYNNGNVYRDYIYVDDSVNAIDLIMKKGDLNEIYNVGNGEKVFIGDVIRYVKEKSKSLSFIKSINPSEFHHIVQVRNMVLDVNKIKKIGYKQEYGVYRSLNILIGDHL